MNRVLAIGGAALLLGLLVLAILGIKSCAEKPTAGEVLGTVVEPARNAGMAAAATDATTITANVMAEASIIDATTRENQVAIRNTPGAIAPVPAAVNAAGLRALCMRQAGARDPRCAALLAARRQPAR